MTIYRYVLVDRDDNCHDYEYDNYQEAEAAARSQGCAVVVREYEYAHSGLAWTPDGGDTWPPKKDAGGIK